MNAAERAQQVLGYVEEAGVNWPDPARRARCLVAALEMAELETGREGWTERDWVGMGFLAQAVAVQLVNARGRSDAT